MATRGRHQTAQPGRQGGSSAPGPVLLGTLSARVDPDAERLAIASALEADVPLVVVNAIPLMFRDEDYEAVRATARRAAGYGLLVEHLRVTSPRPAKALVRVANARGAGLLVLGPKRSRVSRWRFWRAVREVRRHAACLVWIPD